MTTTESIAPTRAHPYGGSLQLTQVTARRGHEAVATINAVSGTFERTYDGRLRLRLRLIDRLDLAFLDFASRGPVEELTVWSSCVELGAIYGAFRWTASSGPFRIATAVLSGTAPTTPVIETIINDRPDGGDDLTVTYQTEQPPMPEAWTRSSADHYPHMPDDARRELVTTLGGEL